MFFPRTSVEDLVFLAGSSSDRVLSERIVDLSPLLHPERFALIAALPVFGPRSSAALGYTVSCRGLTARDALFREYVSPLPLLARAGCELAYYWWVSEGDLAVNLSEWSVVIGQVAADDCLVPALELLRDARLQERFTGPGCMVESNRFVRALCVVAATM